MSAANCLIWKLTMVKNLNIWIPRVFAAASASSRFKGDVDINYFI